MKNFYFSITFLIAGLVAFAQQSVPYDMNFESPTPPAGWTHYAISGNDDWMFGHPYVALTPESKGWETNLGNNYAVELSDRALETPAFDLSGSSAPLALSFRHVTDGNSQFKFYLEYTINNGTTWTLLNTALTTKKKNWQTSAGFSTAYSTFQQSSVLLDAVQGQSNVKFRFRVVTTGSSTFDNGWIIEDFYVGPERFNIVAGQGNEVVSSPNCPSVKIEYNMAFQNEYGQYAATQTAYYWSTNTTLDGSDILLNTVNTSIAGNATVTQTFNVPQGLTPGMYYIIYKYDNLNVVVESNEVDNVSYTPIHIKPIVSLPYFQDFEDPAADNWSVNWPYAFEPSIWELGEGTRHHLEGTYSGEKAWHTSKSADFSWSDDTFPEYIGTHFVESGYFDLTTATGPITMNFWFKDHYDTGINYYDNEYKIEYNLNCATNWVELGVIPQNTDDEWDSFNLELNEIASNETVKFRISFHSNYLNPEGVIVDDIYIGPSKPDLSIERRQYLRYTTSNDSQMTLKYYLMNSGNVDAPATNIHFYWSANNVFDPSDISLGTHSPNALEAGQDAWNEFTFTKPQTAVGTYYVFYVIDETNAIDEMRESNNSSYFTLSQTAPVAVPYVTDFESNSAGWEHNSDIGADDWQYGTVPQNSNLGQAFSGTKAFWAQNTNGILTSMSRMQLVSPVFDLTAYQKPVIEFSMQLDSDGGCYCFNGSTNMSYSIDGGATWTVLAPVNEAYSRWYKWKEYNVYSATDDYEGVNYSEILDKPSENTFATARQFNGRDVDRLTYYAMDAEFLQQHDNIRFRLSTATLLNDGSINSVAKGIIVDDFKIREAFVDLTVPQTKQLFASDLSDKLGITMYIKNLGNGRTTASTAKFYLSTDVNPDASDHFLGEVAVSQIAPDTKFYLNRQFDVSVALGDYQYLVYNVDANNTNAESDENNNTGAWPLMTQGITQYPYINNFDADVIDGWNARSEEGFASGIPDVYRMRHNKSLANPSYFHEAQGVWFTEQVPAGSFNEYYTPTFYLQSPSFDFSTATEPLFIAFDFFMNGSFQNNGGNLEYSTDGGNTWALMIMSMGASTNWYSSNSTFALQDMNGQPGWNNNGGDYIWKRATFNLAFLNGQTDVVFRFKHYSNFTSMNAIPMGFRMDNFTIGSATDINLCLADLPYNNDFSTFPGSCWSESNNSTLASGENNQNGEWVVATNFANGASNVSAKINLGPATPAVGDWLVSPDFDIDGTDMPNPNGTPATTSFLAKFKIALTQQGNVSTTSLDADDIVHFVYSQNDGPWTILRTWNAATPISATGEQIQVPVELSGRVKFAFWASKGSTQTGSNDFFLDNFQLMQGSLGVVDQQEMQLRYFPNPITDTFTLEAATDIESISVFTLSGRKIVEVEPMSTGAEIDLSDLSAGFYLVKIESGGKTKTLKVVKK
ncbi:MAG: T9SS type A sorting domain-containing protein [Flavobacterium sp.]|uniref:CARDB domain-containing protein n=1 Tax=Flavobacterium sp. TaxID=239 RepID=UPI00121B0DE4|nr:CARDB domain-containing protein [Flavobacterium sp.]RZJ64432.1 MAG: T9SS type A sorting domain-containing protein [Flavobacterium sp.]